MGFLGFNIFNKEKTIFNIEPGDPEIRNIKNTFDSCLRDDLSINDIIGLIGRNGKLKFEQLPKDLKFRVAFQIKITYPGIIPDFKFLKWKMNLFSKKTLEELK